MASCAHSVSDILQGTAPEAVRPIPIPQTACPYLQLVSVAATNAGAPWHDAFQPSPDWNHFAAELSAPLAALDIAPPAHEDQPAEVDRLVALGATRVDISQGDVSWVVMADPDGNEFCVLTPG